MTFPASLDTSGILMSKTALLNLRFLGIRSYFSCVGQNMNKLRYSSSSTCLVVLIHITVFLVPNLSYAEGFDPLLELRPQSRSTRIRPRSKRVLFLGEFGAQGDGLRDDTKVENPPTSVTFQLHNYVFCRLAYSN